MPYDADKAPDPEQWRKLDAFDRLDLVKLIVENQVAMGDAPAVPATLDRLMREGLDRHDTIHAIGSVLMGIL